MEDLRKALYTVWAESFRTILAYVNVKLPVELGDEVLEKKPLGYRSQAEFVAEAVRNELIQIKK